MSVEKLIFFNFMVQFLRRWKFNYFTRVDTFRQFSMISLTLSVYVMVCLAQLSHPTFEFKHCEGKKSIIVTDIATKIYCGKDNFSTIIIFIFPSSQNYFLLPFSSALDVIYRKLFIFFIKEKNIRCHFFQSEKWTFLQSKIFVRLLVFLFFPFINCINICWNRFFFIRCQSVLFNCLIARNLKSTATLVN